MKNKKHLPFILILLFSLLFVFGEETNIFTSLAMASLLLVPVTLIKPSLAFPFLKDINRKKGVPILILFFFLGVMLSPTSKTKPYSLEEKPSPTKKEEAKLTPTGEAKGAQAKTLTPSPKKNLTPTSKLTSTPVPTSTPAPTLTPKPETTVKVTRVIDGDTVELENGQRVRYIGIDTPETYECFASQATQKNKELVLGKYGTLIKDVSEVDKYGRFLRYVYVGGVFVNDYLVRQGYANASTYPPDVRYADQFRQAEREARENKRGLWADGVCDSEPQYIPPPTNTPVAGVPGQSSDCVIKGNISYKTGEKIYHLPGCPNYNQTKIDESKRERWFCSEQEAVSAGWRKAKNCP